MTISVVGFLLLNQFIFRWALNYAKIIKAFFIVGPINGMDLALLLPGNETLKFLGLPQWNLGKKDKQMQNILSTFWYNFIKTG